MRERKAATRAAAKREPDPLVLRQADETVAQIRALWRDLFRSPFDEAAEHGLTGPQVTVIARLVAGGPTTLTDLSRALGMTHSTASGIVDRLEARGLVERRQDPEDRRRTVISVTATVTQYVGTLELGPAGRVASALARASASERRTIRAGLSLLCQLLDRRAQETAAAPPATKTRRRRDGGGD